IPTEFCAPQRKSLSAINRHNQQLFDHLGGAREQHTWYADTERLGGGQVNAGLWGMAGAFDNRAALCLTLTNGEIDMATTSTMSSSNAHHPTAWYSEMTSREKTTFWACIGGWILDAMDVQMLSFAIPAIIAVFSISNADAGLIGTATLLASAFGGW